MKKQNKKCQNVRFNDEKLKTKSLMFLVSFFHVFCKISNFNMWTAKYLAQASCTELTLLFFQGKEVPNSVQLFYIGCFVFIGSLFCEFIDKDDKFFTPYINEIPLTVEFVK